LGRSRKAKDHEQGKNELFHRVLVLGNFLWDDIKLYYADLCHV
jgi:hypothetical protein